MTTLLLVDDEGDVLAVQAMLLELEGFEVATATDGRTALDRIQRGAIDLVLTDLMMPRMDGLALCRQLRGDPSTRTIPIILHSAGTTDPPGAGELYDIFLPKPTRLGHQLAAIRRLLPP